MKPLFVPPLPAGIPAAELPEVMDTSRLSWHPIASANWAEYPFRPQAAFRIAYTPEGFCLHFRVGEPDLRARYGEDNGSVWTDSCVEFFLQPTPDGPYYNIECNCIGTLLLGVGTGRYDRVRIPAEKLRATDRYASLGRTPFETRPAQGAWEVALSVPYGLFSRHTLAPKPGDTMRGNFYKCGDELPRPHFLSWNPIRTPQPDFHRPEWFGEMIFG